MVRRVFILGLDSLPPYVLYEGHDGGGFKYLRSIVEDSARYLLESCHPPITVPAWIVMFTGKTPGELGIYGFRHRRVGMFDYYIINSNYIKYPAIWDEAGKKGLWVGIYGVPPTYPPKPVHGFMVTDFTTPDPNRTYTFPPWLKRELENVSGPTIFDVTYRSEDKDGVARDIRRMINNHLTQVTYLLKRKKWDLFIYVEIGIDRVHHAFWKYFDKRHPRFIDHPEYSKVIPEVYRRIDEWFSSIHNNLLKDSIIIIASDHGVKPMIGAFTINQWLIDEGYLKLKVNTQELRPGTDLREDMIDWKHTIAWGWGGYYSRIFINLKGREKYGVVSKEEYESIIHSLRRNIENIKGPKGDKWYNSVYRPHELYPEVRGDAPDLMVYLDDLNWRPAGTLGWQSRYLPENDRGPDDAMHDWMGVLSIYDPEGTIPRGDLGVMKIGNVRNVIEELLFGRK